MIYLFQIIFYFLVGLLLYKFDQHNDLKKVSLLARQCKSMGGLTSVAADPCRPKRGRGPRGAMGIQIIGFRSSHQHSNGLTP
jgi:hypothetical protein